MANHSATYPHPVLFLDTRQAAEYLNQSPRTLERWRVTGGGPRFVKSGGSVRYRLTELEAWAEARTVRSTSESTRFAEEGCS